MLERLDYLKLAPRRILDAASGPPRRALGKRYPGAQVIALDFSLGMLRPGEEFFLALIRFCARTWSACRSRPKRSISPGATWRCTGCRIRLPALREFARVLVPEGLLMFSTLGPDTLKELRAAAGAARVHAFTDMHDLGDMLVAAGFTAPVMDMEMLDIAYRDPASLLDGPARQRTDQRAHRPAARPRGAALLRGAARQARAEGDFRSGLRSRVEGPRT